MTDLTAESEALLYDRYDLVDENGYRAPMSHTRTQFRARLAAIEAAVRATAAADRARLADALTDLLAEQFCVASGGGTEGKWCMNHDDYPMANDAECALIVRCRAALARSGAGQ